MDIHKHTFEKPELLRINIIKNPNYNGAAGDKALLVRTCECKKQQAFDYGPYQEMRMSLRRLLTQPTPDEIALHFKDSDDDK